MDCGNQEILKMAMLVSSKKWTADSNRQIVRFYVYASAFGNYFELASHFIKILFMKIKFI